MKRLLADAQMTANGISTALDLIDGATQNLTDDGTLPFSAIDQYFGNANLFVATPDGSKFAKGALSPRLIATADLPTDVALLSRKPQVFSGSNKFLRIATSRTTMTLVNGANQNIMLPNSGIAVIIGPTMAWTLGGIVAPSATLDGLEITMFNATAQAGALNHLDAGSTAGNQFLCPGGVNLAIVAPYGVVTIVMDMTTGAWFVKSHN